MPTVTVRLYPNKSRPILISSVVDPSDYWECPVSHFLSMDIEALIAANATWRDLVSSRRVKAPMAWNIEPLDVETIDDALNSLGPPQTK